MIIQTPATAIKNEEFTKTLLSSYKNELKLNGRNVTQVTFDTPNYTLEIPLIENYYFYLTSDAAIVDNDIFEDSENNQYPCYIYNQLQISINQLFGLILKNNIVHLYPL